MSVSSRLILPLGALAAALSLASCGEDDFANEPRPAAPVQLTARIGDDDVTVSPQAVGAGIVSITISNQSKEPASLVLEGPTDESSEEIAPNNVATIKISLDEGDYTATAGEGNEQREDVLRVGTERASSSNELLLP